MLDPWLIPVRLALYAALALGFGLPAFMLHALGNDADAAITRRLFRLTAVAAVVGIVASGFALWMMARDMASSSDPGATWDTARVLLMETAVGTTWVIRVVLLALVAGIATLRVAPERVRIAALAAIGAVALATLAWAGHGAMSEGDMAWLHLGADIIHLLAAGVWVGTLVALVLIAREASIAADTFPAQLLSRAAGGFARLGSVVVAALLVSGTINYLLIVGPSVSELVDTLYGRILLAKLAVFTGMLALAAANRFRLAPALEFALQTGNTLRAVAALKRSLWLETALIFGVLVLVAGLGMLDPGA
ncbi:MAG: copper homeostasis membrane protein CopD [Proteobacteria bacterium]|nr:copper homeostasis membrane protein CopD [Pseudomonadota bacterium]